MDFTSFPIWMPFIYFSCLIALARTSNTVLNRSGESKHPKAFILSPLNVMCVSCGILIHNLYYVEVVPSSLSFLSVFIKMILNFIKCFYLHQLRWSCGISLFVINVWHITLIFHLLNHPCLSRINPTFSKGLK